MNEEEFLDQLFNILTLDVDIDNDSTTNIALHKTYGHHNIYAEANIKDLKVSLRMRRTELVKLLNQFGETFAII